MVQIILLYQKEYFLLRFIHKYFNVRLIQKPIKEVFIGLGNQSDDDDMISIGDNGDNEDNSDTENVSKIDKKSSEKKLRLQNQASLKEDFKNSVYI